MNVTNYIQWFQTDVVDPVLNGPVWIVVFVLCLFAGAFLKRVPEHWVPNRLVPALVWITGGFLMLFLGPVAPATVEARTWRTRNLTLGLVVGFAAWLAHRYGVKPLWAYARSKVPWLAQAPDSIAPFGDDVPSTFKQPPPAVPAAVPVQVTTNEPKQNT